MTTMAGNRTRQRSFKQHLRATSWTTIGREEGKGGEKKREGEKDNGFGLGF